MVVKPLSLKPFRAYSVSFSLIFSSPNEGLAQT